MTVLNFPDTTGQPTDGSFQYTENGVVYTWDGVKWTANSEAAFVNISGDTMTGNLTVPSLNGGPLAGFRNQIINGNMAVFQRATSGNTTVSIEYLTADRWRIGGNVGSVGVIDSPNGKALQQNQAGQYQQRIELLGAGIRGPYQENSLWTLSFWSKNNLADITATSARFATDTLTNSSDWDVETPLAQVAVDGDWRRYSITFRVGTIAATDLFVLVFVVFDKLSTFTLAQFEPGPIATPFEHRPIGTELSLCQRYYQRVVGKMICSARSRGSTDQWTVLSYARQVPMRDNPIEAGTITGNADTIQYNGKADSVQILVQNSLLSENGVENYTADAEL